MGTSPNRQYGAVAVGLADGVVIPANPLRRSIRISNPTTNPIYIAFGRAAVAGQDIVIPPNALPVTFSDADWPGLIQLDIHAITTGATGFLCGIARLDQQAT